MTVSTKARRAIHAGGVVAVYRLTMTAASGTVEHEQLLIVHDMGGPATRRPTSADARQAADGWCNARDHITRRALAAYCDEPVSTLHAAHQEAVASLERREHEIARAAASTARQLVQAGLFDRRAVRAQSSRRRAAGVLLDESERRRAHLARESTLAATIDLVALLLPGSSS